MKKQSIRSHDIFYIKVLITNGKKKNIEKKIGEGEKRYGKVYAKRIARVVVDVDEFLSIARLRSKKKIDQGSRERVLSGPRFDVDSRNPSTYSVNHRVTKRR